MPGFFSDDAVSFINTWLQPGDCRASRSGKSFKRFSELVAFPPFTWLKPGVNESQQRHPRKQLRCTSKLNSASDQIASPE